MAGSFNRVFLMGNLTRDVELKYTNSNKAVASVSVAVNHRFKQADGNVKEEVTYVDCEAWGQTAETLSKFLGKGRPVFIEGRLKQETWQDKTDGSNRSKLKVVIETWTFVDSKPQDGQRTQAPTATAAPQRRATQAAQRDGYTPLSGDDIPFDHARI